MKLSDLLVEGCGLVRLFGSEGVEVENLARDSRAVRKGSMFFAVKGTQVDGHDFIPDALQKGAVAVVCQDVPEEKAPGVCYVQVEDSGRALGFMASAFYGNPSRALKLVGVTGTNGKTTTVTLLYRLFRSLGYEAGLLSTIENRIGATRIPSTHTTGDALEINSLLRRMVDAGCDYAFMEVSSHAVVQERIAGLQFAGGVFSNLTRDHLDYHKTFEAYLKAKKKFFDQLPASAFALANADDRNGLVMLQNTSARKLTYSLRTPADFMCKVVEDSLQGLHLEMDRKEVYMRLVGRFNAYNLTAIYAVAVCLGMDRDQVLCAMSRLQEAPGRFERLEAESGSKTGIVDYAHTPDALENLLETVSDLLLPGQGIVCVVGCGGNRDAGKRPEMARIACRYAAKVVFTNDNPRYEEPESILQQMLSGLDQAQRNAVLVIPDREQAIKTACMLAAGSDVVVVAGKGHEAYQEIEGVKHPFDDREILARYLPARWENALQEA